MRVAYLTSQYPATSHTFIRREVEALRRAGVDIATFSIRKPSAGERADAENVSAFQSTTYVLPANPLGLVTAHAGACLRNPARYFRTLRDALRHRVPGVKGWVYSIIYFAEALVLVRAFRQRGVEHLHNHFANPAAIVGYLATRHMGIGFSLTLHGISEFDYPAGLLLREKLEHARFVACVSHFGRAQAMRITPPQAWSKMFIVRCGIDTERFGSRPAPASSARLRLLHVGRLSAEKGQAGLMTAFAHMRQRGVDAELRILGDGPLENDLKQQARDLGLEDHCVFLGRKGEAGVLEELRMAHAFVIASFMEGLPVVLMEAMACEVPVVAPCVAGIPELVVHNETGLLFTPGDWDALEEQLHRLLSDVDMRSRLGLAGRQRVLQHFDIERAVRPLVGLFSRQGV